MNKKDRVVLGITALALLPLSVLAAHFGETLPKGEAISIAAAAEHASDYAGTPNLFAGRITQVCQTEGCWLVIEENGTAARVMVKDHAFSVPKDASGHAVVYGVLSETKMSQEAAEHMAKDAGQDTPVNRNEIRILVTGIDIAE